VTARNQYTPPNVRQPYEIRPGEFASFLTTLNAVGKIHDKRAVPAPRRA